MTFIVYNFHWWKWFFKVATVPLVSIQTTITSYFDQNQKLWKKSYETTDAGTSSKKTLKSRLYTAVLPFSTGSMWGGALCREEQVSPAICFLLKCRKISASNLESVGDKAVWLFLWPIRTILIILAKAILEDRSIPIPQLVFY